MGMLSRQVTEVGMRLTSRRGAYGGFLVACINKIRYAIWAWLTRPGNVGYGSTTIDYPLSSLSREWHKDELMEWDRSFRQNTGRSVEKILNPPPPKREDYHVLTKCTCSHCMGTKKLKAKLGDKR